ncbi:MAG TPA: hypothetical protein VK177_16525 [Flavobacteriales bacterium]|nr:hypothetical protein [Flavobacteriales bacterium]
MKHRIECLRWLLFLVTFQFFFFSCATGEKPEVLIRQTFQTYKNAILHEEYHKAASCLDSKTIAYYGSILEHVRYSDSVTIGSMAIMDKLAILMSRSVFTKQDISEVNGESFFALLLSKNVVEKESMVSSLIGEVEIDGNFAIGELLTKELEKKKKEGQVKGEAIPKVQFYLEGEKWKLNLTSLMEKVNVVFRNMLAKKGADENKTLYEMVLLEPGKLNNKNLWEPLMNRF